ncbi:GlsB/YeaQ/YmgE family stress response membrane protein [Sphingomonas sp. CJ20]
MSTGIFGALVVGVVAGALGTRVMPGKDPGGIVVTIVIGIAGALLAFYLTPLLGIDVRDNVGRACAAAALGSVALLALYRLVIARRI